LILLLAIIAGLLFATIRAWYGKRSFLIPDLRAVWLVITAFAPQWLAFYLPLTRRLVTKELAAGALTTSQLLLLFFVWFNRKQSGFWILGVGLILNLAVIGLNGGLMPITPETLGRMVPDRPIGSWLIGSRVGNAKDVVLPTQQTRLAWLSDRFLLPRWFPYQAAFSAGDVFIAIGAFWWLWESAAPHFKKET